MGLLKNKSLEFIDKFFQKLTNILILKFENIQY